MTDATSPSRSCCCEHSATCAVAANESSRLYVEVENGERVVLPPGMTEVDLLKSMVRQLLLAAAS